MSDYAEQIPDQEKVLVRVSYSFNLFSCWFIALVLKCMIIYSVLYVCIHTVAGSIWIWIM